MTPAGGAAIAFKNIFEQEYSKLCRYALTFLNDSHQAEDVVQETFIKIWERKQEIISSPEMRFYLVTAVRNNCISALRKLKTQNTTFTENTPEPEPELHFTISQHQEEANEQAKKIANALDLLPPKCKEVFLLVKMQGLSYKQTAETLDISVKTVENQMGKAIKVLRENVSVPLLLLSGLLSLQDLKRPFDFLWQFIKTRC
jgi:RNA polymerase sigma-70 factor (ECF subfamily)